MPVPGPVRHATAMTRPTTARQGPAGAAGVVPWTAVGLVGALTGLLAWLLLRWSADCESFECLGTALIALAVGVVVLPLVAVTGLALLHVARPVRTGVLGCLAAVSLVSAAVSLQGALVSVAPGAVASLPTVALASAVSGWAGLVVGSDRFATARRWTTGLAVALVLAVSAAAS